MGPRILLLYIQLYSVFSADQNLSHVLGDDDEAYDYKFVKWMIKEKVEFINNMHFSLILM